MVKKNIMIRLFIEQEIVNQYGTVNKFCSTTKDFKQPDLHKFLNGGKDYRLEKILRLLALLDIDIQFLFNRDRTKNRFQLSENSPNRIDEQLYIQKGITLEK